MSIFLAIKISANKFIMNKILKFQIKTGSVEKARMGVGEARRVSSAGLGLSSPGGMES